MESIALPDTLPEPLRVVHFAHFSGLDPITQSARIIDRIIQASKLPTRTSETATLDEIETADQERSDLDFAFVDPTKLCSKQHILTAVLQAVIVCARSWDADHSSFREGQGSLGGMKSKTPHSEIIYMLNPGNNVGESLKRFGLSAKSTSLLLIKFSPITSSPESILRSMSNVVSQTNSTSEHANVHLSSPSISASNSSVDIDQAIRYDRYLSADQSQLSRIVTDWKDLNKIYKLQMPSEVLSGVQDAPPSVLRGFEDIICTSVAMKLVAA